LGFAGENCTGALLFHSLTNFDQVPVSGASARCHSSSATSTTSATTLVEMTSRTG
jgi:hypothetical protein